MKKTCSKCQTRKLLEHFDLSAKYKCGRRSECKLCRRAAYFANVAVEKEKRRVWREANKAAAAENHARWVKENKNHVLSYQDWYRNQPENKARKAARSAAQPVQNVARVMLRRATKIRATPAWADLAAIERVYARAARKRLRTGEVWHVDHVVPLQSQFVCGLHCEANLKIIPAAVNIAKRNRHWPQMWRPLPL